MDVNADACCLIPCVVIGIIASMLAPTKRCDRYRLNRPTMVFRSTANRDNSLLAALV